jgi:succinate dehydrogenase/fumarate reductase flavoprotein subunit
MQTLIIGKGLSGLATAIRIKQINPRCKVMLLERRFPQGNTYIAGQRIRAGIAQKRKSPIQEVMSLLLNRNSGILTKPMFEFANTLHSEIDHWHKMGVPYRDHDKWFGPQWGRRELLGVSKAYSVIDWFTQQAEHMGVRFLHSDVLSIHRKNDVITNIVGIDTSGTKICISADAYVFAGGSCTGLLFDSTNRCITNPPQLLAKQINVPLVGGAVSMLHPFGIKSSQGSTLIGCYETDALAQCRVLDHNNNRLTQIESMLRRHQTHYHFPALCKMLQKRGGRVRIVDSQNNEKHAGVSVHYNQMGIQTNDGVSLVGVSNAFAVGDASGVSYWTNGHERYPGFGLGNCLVTAFKTATIISNMTQKQSNFRIDTCTTSLPSSQTARPSSSVQAMRKLNTEKVIGYTLGLVKDTSFFIRDWEQQLDILEISTTSSMLEKQVRSLSRVLIEHHRERISLLTDHS